MNAGTFNTCLDSGKHKDETTKDMTDGQNSGIDGTPGFWILGPNNQTKQISGAYPYATFQAAFDEMLK
jgi:predicted DsbA family dithiol-disulfide isomerase